MNRTPLILLALLVSSSLGRTAWCQPSLSRAVPSAVQPGQTTQITLHGAKLAGVAQIWTSFAADMEILPGGTASQVVCKLTLAADAPLGVGAVVVGTSAGASNMLLLAIDDMSSVLDNGKNHRREDAQPIEWPLAVDGILDGSRTDHYRVEGKAGQRIAAEVFAGRLDSAADPVIRLLSAQGVELRMSDDEPGLGPDCRWEYTFPEDGSYFIQVHDNKYQAGGFYRLRVGDFPLVTTAMPLGARRGSTVKFGFAALPARGPPDAPDPNPVLARIADTRQTESWGLAARFVDGKSSAITRLVVSDVPERLEREPNNEIETALEVVIPTAVNGRLQTDGDADFYVFHAVGKQPLDIRAVAARLGSPTVPMLTIRSADGRTLAESKFGEVADPSITFTPPADGAYFLRVQELLDRGGPEYTYRVEIVPSPPFRLSLKNDKNSVLKFALAVGNGAIALPVDCVRSGYDGPIELSLSDPSSGPRLLNSTIPAKAKAAQPVVIVPTSFQPGDLRVGRLVGTATVNGRRVSSIVSTAAVVRAKRPRVAYVPSWMDGRLAFATIAGPAAAPFDVTIEPDMVLLPRPLATAQFTLRPKRTNKEFKDALQVFVDGLPEGVTAEVKKEGKAADELVRITLKGSPDSPVSVNPIRLTVYASFKGRGYALRPNVQLRVFDPISVQPKLPGPIEAGKKQSLTVHVQRDGDDPQPLTLKLEGLPTGVSGATEATIPADQNEATIELTAAADVAAGKHPLVVHAATTYQGQQVKADSQPIELEITKP